MHFPHDCTMALFLVAFSCCLPSPFPAHSPSISIHYIEIKPNAGTSAFCSKKNHYSTISVVNAQCTCTNVPISGGHIIRTLLNLSMRSTSQSIQWKPFKKLLCSHVSFICLISSCWDCHENAQDPVNQSCVRTISRIGRTFQSTFLWSHLNHWENMLITLFRCHNHTHTRRCHNHTHPRANRKWGKKNRLRNGHDLVAINFI